MKTKIIKLITFLFTALAVSVPALADDGELLRKSMSSAAGSIVDPIPEAEHAFINYMKFYVPAQTSDGSLTTVEYINADGTPVKTEEVAKPLIGVYIYGPVEGVDGTGFVGHGRRDAYAAVSLDDGNTWKRSNLSESGDKSSFTVSIPIPDPGASAGDGEIIVDADTPIITEAEFEQRRRSAKLEIQGEEADGRRVEIRNAVTQEILFSARVDRDGDFERSSRVDEVPCYVQAGYRGVFGPAVPVEDAPEDCIGKPAAPPITAYPGDVVNIFHAVAGNRVVVAWPSRFCQTGTPAYALEDPDEVASYLGINNEADLYLTDLFGVAGAQGSINFADEGYPEVGEVPFSCLWTARGVLQPDPDNEGAVEMVWFKPERLTSGRRDVNRIEIKMVEGAGAAITWQEDPDGLRPGQGLGPGEGWSGAIAHNQTDIWYSFLPWEAFDTVADDNGDPVPLADYTGDEKPGHYVPFAMPMRLTNNAKCTYPVTTESDAYCDVSVAAAYGLQDFCMAQVEIQVGPNDDPELICVNADGLPNVANTASTRPRLSLQPRDSNDDGVTDSAWVIVVAEEDKGMGSFFFLVGEENVETATACLEGSSEDCETADVGKNMWYYSFDMGSPQTSADLSDTGLVANLVNQGNMLNQPETDWRTGAFYPPLNTELMWGFDDYDFQIYRTEIARRGSLLVQSPSKIETATSSLSALPSWKQGLLNQGGPADTMVRRIVSGTVDNPYDFRNIACDVWTVEPGSSPYYPDGLCADPAINLSSVTPEECEVSGSSDGTCPTIDENGITVDDPEDQQVFDKMLTWFQCPGSELCGTTPESTALGSNLDDQSWHNPLDISKGHRGFLDGDFVMILYAWSPNYKLNAVGTDRYELYVRRSFDGGETWTTTPSALGGAGTVTCETMRNGATSLEDEQRCQAYAAGVDEQARNVSQLKSMAFTILDPRYAPTAGDIVAPAEPLDFAIYPNIDPTDTREPSRYFIVYETGDNTTVDEGEAEPLDLYYGRAVTYGDHYQVWAEEDTAPTDCLPVDAVDPAFCNEFDDLEGRRDTQSSEASVAASPYGDFLYAVWAQWTHDSTTGDLTEADAMFRRVWYLDEYIPSDAPTE